MSSNKELDALAHCLDVTNLSDDADESTIKKLCEKVKNSKLSIASICVKPKFIALVKAAHLRMTTVANFPTGQKSLHQVSACITRAVLNGADEIDVVLPYHDLLNGEIDGTKQFLFGCKKACQDKIMKVILETGALKTHQAIKTACEISIEAGADFLKTSTGKTAQGATLDAAKTMLEAIKQSSKPIGLKVSGGIRDMKTALDYKALAETTLGKTISPDWFRIGASQLFDDITAQVACPSH